MIVTKEDLRYYLSEDWKRYNLSKTQYVIGRFTYGGGKSLQLLRCLRKCEYAYNNRNKSIFNKVYYLIRLYLYRRLQFKLDTYIYLNSVGPGLYIPHLGGIIINCKSMGYNCSVNKNVVIGNKKSQHNRATIGNNCWFTLGSKVIGEITIGDNVIVAPNSVVVKNVERNTIVSGVPAKIVRKFNDINDVSI